MPFFPIFIGFNLNGANFVIFGIVFAVTPYIFETTLGLYFGILDFGTLKNNLELLLGLFDKDEVGYIDVNMLVVDVEIDVLNDTDGLGLGDGDIEGDILGDIEGLNDGDILKDVDGDIDKDFDTDLLTLLLTLLDGDMDLLTDGDKKADID